MKFDNYMILDFPSKSANEAFARSAARQRPFWPGMTLPYPSSPT